MQINNSYVQKEYNLLHYITTIKEINLPWTKVKVTLEPTCCVGDLFVGQVELIELWKYKGERQYVMTEDGYVLSVSRVVPTLKQSPAVLLQHGFLGSSDCWVTDPDALGQLRLAMHLLLLCYPHYNALLVGLIFLRLYYNKY